ncbi:hypothetical protein BpHYR1_017771 [Brachionus plicatilis]|uniref:Uncharacterized protein n=1 Tax=Brachionus plicatilis TaxID=10195 RepID=A0A3M7PGX4_BRAPC|nr:hypothetical protein BpHYR1_017771 [Brachionus plicatilis]
MLKFCNRYINNFEFDLIENKDLNAEQFKKERKGSNKMNLPCHAKKLKSQKHENLLTFLKFAMKL